MSDETQWEAKQPVAVAELGLTEIEEVGEDGVLFIRDRGSTLEFPAEEVERRVRPIVDEETAAALREQFGTLGTPLEEEQAYHRKKQYRAVAKRNDLREMLSTLEGIYRHPDPDYAEERYEERFEKYVFAELAEVLETSEDELARMARAACET